MMGIKLSHLPPALAHLSADSTSKRGNKFHARRTACAHGHTHASKAEAQRCDTLHVLQRAGEIRNLQQQPKFFFAVDGRQVTDERGHRIRYTADFRYEERDRSGAWIDITEDVKSKATMTEAASLRLAFFRASHPDTQLRITGEVGR